MQTHESLGTSYFQGEEFRVFEVVYGQLTLRSGLSDWSSLAMYYYHDLTALSTKGESAKAEAKIDSERMQKHRRKTAQVVNCTQRKVAYLGLASFCSVAQGTSSNQPSRRAKRLERGRLPWVVS